MSKLVYSYILSTKRYCDNRPEDEHMVDLVTSPLGVFRSRSSPHLPSHVPEVAHRKFLFMTTCGETYLSNQHSKNLSIMSLSFSAILNSLFSNSA